MRKKKDRGRRRRERLRRRKLAYALAMIVLRENTPQPANPNRTPIYDEVYFEGLRALDDS